MSGGKVTIDKISEDPRYHLIIENEEKIQKVRDINLVSGYEAEAAAYISDLLKNIDSGDNLILLKIIYASMVHVAYEEMYSLNIANSELAINFSKNISLFFNDDNYFLDQLCLYYEKCNGWITQFYNNVIECILGRRNTFFNIDHVIGSKITPDEVDDDYKVLYWNRYSGMPFYIFIDEKNDTLKISHVGSESLEKSNYLTTINISNNVCAKFKLYNLLPRNYTSTSDGITLRLVDKINARNRDPIFYSLFQEFIVKKTERLTMEIEKDGKRYSIRDYSDFVDFYDGEYYEIINGLLPEALTMYDFIKDNYDESNKNFTKYFSKYSFFTGPNCPNLSGFTFDHHRHYLSTIHFNRIDMEFFFYALNSIVNENNKHLMIEFFGNIAHYLLEVDNLDFDNPSRDDFIGVLKKIFTIVLKDDTSIPFSWQLLIPE